MRNAGSAGRARRPQRPVVNTPHSAFHTPHWGVRRVRLDDFRALVQRLTNDIPQEFQGGVVEVEVSSHAVPHPIRADVYTLGECIPLEWSGSGADLQSRVVLYYGSFKALARLGGFDWRSEAWETLTHELRHHLEWQADLSSLEAYDWAGEQNFARHDGEAFDPVFYRNGEVLGQGAYKVDDDVFLEADPSHARAGDSELVWHGRRYRVDLPPAAPRAWRFVTLEGLDEPPPGDAVLVVPGRVGALDALRRPVAPVTVRARARRLDD
jgi:hypothetical protein